MDSAKIANQADAHPIARPALTLLSSEPRCAAKEFVSHILMREHAGTPGDGHPVIIFPGLATSARSVTPLRKHCESLGYRALDWGRGRNVGTQGAIDDWIRDLAAHTARLLAPYGESATLVGWSLGGLYAREVAKLTKRLVRRVITIGTPFNARRIVRMSAGCIGCSPDRMAISIAD